MTILSYTAFSELEGRGTELITLYVPFNRIHDAHALLRDELGKATNIKSRVTRLSVSSAIKSVQEKLKIISQDSVILVGETDSGWISEIIETPQPLSSIIYRCGPKFFLEPLIRMILTGPTYAIICLDLHEMTLVTLQGTTVTTLIQDKNIIIVRR